MRNRTWIAALALAGCALLAAGCKANDTASPTASGSAGASATAKATRAADEVVAAAEKLRTTSFKFSATTAGVTVDGAADPVTKTATVEMAASMRLLMVDGQMYLKFPPGMPGADALGGGDKWVHLDPSKVSPDKLGVQDPTDPTGGYHTLKTATSVQKVGDRHYKGTLDLTKAPATAANAKRLSLMGDSAKAVPFDVTLDNEGRLSTMDMTMKINGSEVTAHTTFSDFGTRVTATRPAPSEVVEAPDRLYGTLGA
ncbi:hypothetical protein HC028_05750 [Planosporangium flavigriseum]|uniref:Lipoprotein n=1 Tax=Planosporangium flavigriseum TaxID=373681 RepID=A0A8J3PMG4_9ACTN|nr:hypothetical protein [Planosporangium flavigriseum]NJC64015.1 hypothetical protein [Planosporangium flavigriseum]GIG72896.1 hypothetical protein Pfl04_13000 [Planosporangium flavigriseum]